MFCSRCGTRNDDDAKYCEKCGADLGAMPKPSVAGAASAATAPNPTSPAPVYMPPVYQPSQRHAWWYPIGVWVILSGFFAFLDIAATHTVSWSVWPIGILGIFMVGFPLLQLVEGRATQRR